MKPCANKDCPCGFWRHTNVSESCCYIDHPSFYMEDCKAYIPEEPSLAVGMMVTVPNKHNLVECVRELQNIIARHIVKGEA